MKQLSNIPMTLCNIFHQQNYYENHKLSFAIEKFLLHCYFYHSLKDQGGHHRLALVFFTMNACCFCWRLRWPKVVYKVASEVGGREETKSKLGWERKTTRKWQELFGSFSAWLRGRSWYLWTIRMDPLLQPLVGERKKEKAVTCPLLSCLETTDL